VNRVWSGLPLLVALACAADPHESGPPHSPSGTEGDTGAGSGSSAGDTASGAEDDTTLDTSEEGTRGDDTSSEVDDGSSTTAAEDCAPFTPDAPWIQAYETDLVARLSGEAELLPGVTLSDRATPERRAATRDALASELAALGLDPQIHAYDREGANVWVPIDATEDTEAVVVFGAHFDSVPGSPGANDNATGVALAMALSRWLSELPCRGVNVIVVFFDQEEIGLVGSDAFAAFLVAQGLDVVAAHTIDQMGWDADGDRTVELERADPGLFRLYDAASSALPVSVPLTATDTGFTDHVSFRAYGFDAIGLTEEFVSGDTTPHYHLPSDTFATVDLEYLHSSTRLVLQTFGDLTAVP
jgi:hypothetical protein